MNDALSMLFQEARSLHRAGRPGEAAARYRRILQGRPDAADVWYHLGMTDLMASGGDPALAHFRRALALDPDSENILNGLAIASQARANPDAAESWLRRALRCRPDHTASLMNMAALQETKGRPGPARAAWRCAVALAPDRPAAYQRLGQLDALGMGETAARPTLHRASLLRPRGGSAATNARPAGPRRDSGRGSAGTKLVVWVPVDWHWPILERLAGLLERRFPTVIARNPDELAGAAPDIVVGADAGLLKMLRPVLPAATTVHVCHGLISKNVPVRQYDAVDYVCVPSDDSRHRLLASGARPAKDYWVTGFVQMDPLFRAAAQRPAGPAGRPVVLYAPTYNPCLSSAAMMGDRLADFLAGPDCGWTVVVKPHPNMARTAPDVLERWRRLAAGHRDLVLVDPPSGDVVPHLLAADVLVSDVSSVAFQFVALDRPIVFIDNPRRFEDADHFDPDGIEWRWRDIGDRVEDPGQLRRSIGAALAAPGARGVERRRCREQLFSDLTDGRAAERIVEHLAELYRSAR